MSHPQSIFHETTFTSPSLLQDRRTTFHTVGAKAQLDQLRKTGRYDCFNLKWKQGIYDDLSRWPCPPPQYWDSDVAKWIEGACYLLLDEYDAEVDAAVREIVDMICKAQGEDGYLNLYFTVIEPEKRWSNLRDQHELYNAGHMIEAALAHSKYYKNDLMLQPILKYVKLIRSVFGPEEGRRHGYPGHPETELALLRLHAVTGNKEAYELGKYFVEERGNPKGQEGQHYYDWEGDQRGDSPWKRPNSYDHAYDHRHNQSHLPILEQDSIEGHAVRALYLYTGTADLLCLDECGVQKFDKRPDYFAALNRLWNNMVEKKMYLTGGIGAMAKWEGFGIDYFLPQGTDDGGCYNETCASIGVMMLAERLLHLDLDSRYGDVMELCLYNTVLGAIGLDGISYTYVNQLASSKADKDQRSSWFETSCCPPNMMRLFGSLGGYLWDYGSDKSGDAFVNVHLYTKAAVQFETEGGKVSLEQDSDWPRDGKVKFKLQTPSNVNLTVRFRCPSWSPSYKVSPSPQEQFSSSKGYVTVPSSYTSQNSEFTVIFEGFKPRRIYPHPFTNQHIVALARGPVVYCVEDFDNTWEKDYFKNAGLMRETDLLEKPRSMDVNAGVQQAGKQTFEYVELQAKGWVRQSSKGNEADHGADYRGATMPDWQPQVTDAALAASAVDLVFVPYYLRANRGGRGMMRVGLLRG